jgi:hypothetical protein
MVTDSVVVFVVPKGNPEHITTWGDLLKPGVRIFTPNPFSSGSARWNIMAAYGAELKLGNTAPGAEPTSNSSLPTPSCRAPRRAVEFQAFDADEARTRTTSSWTTRTTPSRPSAPGKDQLRHPEADDPHREPDRGDDQLARTPPQRRRS